VKVTIYVEGVERFSARAVQKTVISTDFLRGRHWKNPNRPKKEGRVGLQTHESKKSRIIAKKKSTSM